MLKKRIRFSCINFSIFLILIIQVNFFDIFPSNDFLMNLNSDTNKYLLLIVLLFFAIIKVFTAKHYTHPNQYFKGSTIFFGCSVITIIILSTFSYNQSLQTSFINGYYYLIFPLIYYIYGTHLIDKQNFLDFQKIVTSIGSIEAFIYIINSRFINFLNPVAAIDVSNAASGRSVMGFTRYQSPADFVFFASILLSVTILLKIRKINISFYILQLIMLSYIFFVSQVRTYFLISIAFLLVILGAFLIKRFGYLMPIVGLIFIIIFLGILYLIIDKLGFFHGDRISSMLVRTEAIPYYLSQMFKNIIFGIGFPDVHSNYYLIHGFSNIYRASLFYIEDTGIFGIIGVFGIMALIYLICFFKEIGKAMMMTKNKIQFGLVFIVLIGLFPTLIPLNATRIIFMGFYLIILDFICNYNM